MCVIVAFVPYYAQMQTLRKIDIAENVEEIKLSCILASINNCPIYNQPEFCHHEASGLATISVFPLGVRNVGVFPYSKTIDQGRAQGEGPGGPPPLEPEKHYIFRASSVKLRDLHL